MPGLSYSRGAVYKVVGSLLPLAAPVLLISMYLLRQPKGLEWFLPLFYLKLLVSHLTKEEPCSPNESS
jgi:hypothetical protein